MAYDYLASPYSHPDPKIVTDRYDKVMAHCAELNRRKHWVYSPIVHCHIMAYRHELPTDYEFWQEYNQAMLIPATTLLILRLDGWEESFGVKEEKAFAEKFQIPINYTDPIA